MGITTKSYLPLVSATGFDVAPVSIADETDYSGIVSAGTGDLIAYASMPKGRALLVCVNTGVATSSPTGLTVGLCKASDANGPGTFVSGTTTELGATSVPCDKQYQVEIPLSYVSDSAGYYGIGLAVKGGGSASLIAGTVSMVLDPTYAS